MSDAPTSEAGLINHVAFILEQWDMKERPAEHTGHAYTDIATDVVRKAFATSLRTPASEAGEKVEALRSGLGWLEQCREGGAYVPPVVITEMRDAIERLSATDTEAMRLLREARGLLPDSVLQCHGDKCRLPFCASCFGWEAAEEEQVKVEALLARIDALTKGGAA